MSQKTDATPAAKANFFKRAFVSLQKNGELVEVLLELSPVETAEGYFCESPKSYMDVMGVTLPAMLKELGVHNVEAERFEQEIGGRRYACLTVTGNAGSSGVCQTYLCTERGGCFLLLAVSTESWSQCERILQKMLPESP